MGGLERRLRHLEEAKLPQNRPDPAGPARARMRVALDEIAAARRDGRAPHEEAVAVMKAIERRRARES
jgi:hypothetical protein